MKIVTLFSTSASDFLAKRKPVNIPKLSGKVIWMHAASVGELDQCRALATALRKADSSIKIVQSVFSDSVTQKQLSFPLFDFTFYLPLDLPWAYRKIHQALHPSLLVIMAWDTWPNLIRSARLHNCNVVLACGSLNPDSGRLKGAGKYFARKYFSLINKIYPANQMQIPHFHTLADEDKTGMCGDTRFDSVYQKINNNRPDENFERFAQNFKNRKIIILASTYKTCENMIIPAVENFPDYTFWIFPHKTGTERINEIESALRDRNIDFGKYSTGNISNIVIFDVLGILAFAYRFGTAAYVGGGLDHRIHNVIEPALFGLPVITGPMIKNSPEAIEMRENNGLYTVNDTDEFIITLRKILEDDKFRKHVNEQNARYVLANTGYADKLGSELIEKWIN